MRAEQDWTPTKLRHNKNNRLEVNPTGVAPGSLYITLEAFRALNMCQKYISGHLIDLGSGDVPFYPWYKNSAERITCADWPGTTHSSRHADIFLDLNQPLPLKDGCANSVLLSSVLEHIRNPQGLMREIHRILASEGHLIITVPFMYSLHEEPHDYFRYTEHGLRFMAHDGGFEVVHLQRYGSALGVVVDVSAKVAATIIAAIGNRFPGAVGRLWKAAGFSLVRAWQKLWFFLLHKQPMRWFLNGVGLVQKMPSGYVLVLKKFRNEVRAAELNSQQQSLRADLAAPPAVLWNACPDR